VVAAALLGWVFRQVSATDALRVLLDAPWWTVPAVTAMLLVNTGLYAARVRALLPDRPPLVRVLRPVLIANFVGLVLPGGGTEATKIVLLGRERGHEAALAAIGAARLVESSAWAALLVFAAVAVLPSTTPALLPVAIVGAIGLFGLSGVGLLGAKPAIVLLGRVADDDAVGWRRVFAFAKRTLTRLAAIERRALVVAMGWTVPFSLINCAIGWFVTHQLGGAMPAFDALGAFPTIDLVLAVPITPAAIGVRESTFMFGLAGWGIGGPTAVAIAYARWLGHIGRALVGGVWFVTRGAPAP
jgi:uncharacterized membrane protein YbhN (UPF0104 family)